MSPRDVALAVMTMAIWGFNFVVIKVGLDSFPPLLFSALRFALAAVPLVFFVGPPRVAWRYIIGIGLALGVAKFGLLFIGMSALPVWGGMPAGLASLVLQAQAFFTILFASVTLGERPRLLQLIGMGVAFTGIGLLAVEAGQSGPIQAIGLTVLAAAFWGVSNILMKRANPPDVFRLIVWVSIVPPLPLFALSWLFEGPAQISSALTHISWRGISALVYISFLSTVVGFAIWGRLLRRYKANLVAPFSLLVPIFGLLSAALVLNEQLSPIKGIAALLVLAGLGLNVWQGRPVKQATRPA
ncbi:EamA family transporter [Leptolyngbya sp. FACHB-261]|uniref:EamA family transporter n=1 Tax=Leptolyngbya sp. FACHB-261 TaxID=2692806 RepID=UPI001681D94C|nr:EamA family transporter [Leptolyngbya sp. FACHB-261]MBD2100580.1 EamA family transporter [Leptolyngbya sp. FACHB-261]